MGYPRHGQIAPLPHLTAMGRSVAYRGGQDDCTPEMRLAIADRVRVGCTVRVAAVRIGLDPRRVKAWLAIATAFTSGPYWELAQACEAAEAEYLEQLTLSVREGSLKDGKLALEVLARRDPEAWGKRDAVRVEGHTGGAVQVEHTGTVNFGELARRIHDVVAGVTSGGTGQDDGLSDEFYASAMEADPDR
jgi:hypothetical protein